MEINGWIEMQIWKWMDLWMDGWKVDSQDGTRGDCDMV